jgi:hypothetical protein
MFEIKEVEKVGATVDLWNCVYWVAYSLYWAFRGAIILT